MSSKEHDATTEPTRTGYAQYLRAARHLRYAINSNLADHDFAYKKHGEIRYLFDTNVVRFFLNPTPETQAILGGLVLDEEIRASLAIVTAEYMFSRQLCGQWGTPALISAAHAKEIEGHASSIITHLNQQLSRFDSQSTLRERIAEAIIKAGQQDEVETSIRMIFQSDTDVRKIISDEAYEAQMFLRIAREDLLAPLSSDILMTEEILKPSRREITEWTKRVASERRKLPGRQKEHNDQADGETLTQLVMLNRAAEKQRVRVRYVLLTFDSAIHRAVIKAPRQMRDLARTRRIEQYLPILNLQEMPNQVDHASFVSDIGAAIDALLTGTSEPKSSSPSQRDSNSDPTSTERALGQNPSPARSAPRQLFGQFSRPTLDNLPAMWGKLASECVYLNACLLSKRLDAFSELADFLNDSNAVRDAVVGYMERTIRDVESVHVRFNIENLLISAIQRHGVRNELPTRGLLLIRSRFARFTGDTSLYEFLNELVLSGDDTMLDSVFTDTDESQHHISLLFAGCIAFWAGAWQSASFFADRAAESFRRTQNRVRRDPVTAREIEYFGIVTRRYALMDEAQDAVRRFERLRETLCVIDAARKTTDPKADSFAAFRLDLEHSLLLIAMGYASLLCETTGPGEGTDWVGLALQRLTVSQRQSREITETVADSLLRKQIEAEIHIGLIGCILYYFFFASRFPEELWSSMESIRHKLEELSSDQAKIVPQLYRLAPGFIDLMMEPSEEKRRAITGDLQQHLRSTECEIVPATSLDKAVMEKIATRLASTLDSWTHRRQ